MSRIQVVGIGLEGATGLAPAQQQQLRQADVITGSPRQLQGVPPELPRWEMARVADLIEQLQRWLERPQPERIVVLASGDPLFFGLGRLLLTQLPPEQLSFYPHLSSVQLAFSRIKRPWQGAEVVSLHGRSPQRLLSVLRSNPPLVAVLTDSDHGPSAIAGLLQDLELPQPYTLWVCENLGGDGERVYALDLEAAKTCICAPLTVVVLERQPPPLPTVLPQLGLPDSAFLSFADRPGLITKREVRVQILGELQLQSAQVLWDVGAGTGSVSLEVGRLLPSAQVYAVEKTAAGIALIQANCQRLGVSNVRAIAGKAPAILADLPAPDRVFVGGSGGQLTEILDHCQQRLRSGGRITLALATLEHQQQVIAWQHQHRWRGRWLQVQLARSVAVSTLTRWAPLNPVTLATLWPQLTGQ